MRLFTTSALFLALLFTLSLASDRVSFFSSHKESFYHKASSVVPDNSDVVERSAQLCPVECSHHGTCDDGNCRCDSGWTGEACSIEVTPLSPNLRLANQRVAARQFHYYKVSVGGRKSLSFEVNGTGSGNADNDCDLFEKFQTFPELHDYDQRDISVGQNSRLDVRSKGAGDYYLGVFGFTECEYSVEAIVQNDCPNGCSGHGTCHNEEGGAVCVCHSGWAGPDCNTEVVNMSPYHSYSGSAQSGAWTMYEYQMPSDYDALQIIVNQTSTGGDADLFVRHGKIPSLREYDYVENGVARNFVLRIDDPPSGKLYIGVYAFSEVSWHIKTEPFQDCNNDCSGGTHGVCSERGCSCRAGYEGTYCQTKTESLVDKEVVDGFVADSAWNYYHYDADTADALTLTVVQKHMFGNHNPDCDVYVRASSNPTFDDFDYRDLGFTDDIQIQIEEGHVNTKWYIGVFGYSPCAYSLNVTLASHCPSGCSRHGTCLSDHTCSCDDGWAGESCDHQVSTLQSSTVVSGAVGANDWAYYVLPDVATSYVSIHMEETNTTGFVWLYVEENQYPTRQSHQYESQTDSQYHVIEIQTGIEKGQKKDYFIGVYGSPFVLDGEEAPFEIEAWVPPF